MNKQLALARSPVTNKIYAGHVQSPGVFASNKQDVTIEALEAVAEHTLHFGEPVVISDGDGNPLFKISVVRLAGGDTNE